MAQPSHISSILHEWQAKRSTQIQEACNNDYIGMILADCMGLGKTPTAMDKIWIENNNSSFKLAEVARNR